MAPPAATTIIGCARPSLSLSPSSSSSHQAAALGLGQAWSSRRPSTVSTTVSLLESFKPLESSLPALRSDRLQNVGLQNVARLTGRTSQLGISTSSSSNRRSSAVPANRAKSEKQAAEQAQQQQGEEEEDVELSWVEEKVEDVAQFAGSVVRAVPGPRVGGGDLPWLLALPIGYLAISFVFATVKTFRKYTSPKGRRTRQIGKNAWLVESLSEYLPAKRDELDSKTFKQVAAKCKFENDEVLRKYIRYALNERPFDPELVADLIHLRKVSALDSERVAEVLNEVSRRIVKAKGPVIVDTTGFTERGLKRKVAVQALFSKVLYLAELDEFCSTANRSSLSIKEIFGVTDEDANLIRIDTLSGRSEEESLEKMIESPSSEEDLD